MSVPIYSHIHPELGRSEVDARSVHAFSHGFPSPLVRWHFHNEYELHLIVETSGKMFVGDHVSSFAPGQLILMGPCLPHNWVSEMNLDSATPMRDCVVQFRRELIESMAACAPELKRLLPLLERSRHGLEFQGKVCIDAERWFDEIINDDGSRAVGLLLDFLERLSREKNIRQLSTVPVPSGKCISQLKKLERAIEHTTEFHASVIRVESIASLVGMSKNSFSHFFTKATGSTFVQFLNGVRVAHACELLSDTDIPITEICHTVGFNNVANFNRRFRELKNLTPSSYRKETQLGRKLIL